MPELPEVNTVKKGFEETVLQLMITGVEVHDSKIIRNVGSEEFVSALVGRRFVDTYRQGKYFFGVLDTGLNVLFHLGMTGDLMYYYLREERSKYERFNIHFSNDLILGYDDLRKFSHILLLPDRNRYLKEIKLGPDALKISQQDFYQIFIGKKTTLKSVLLDQQLLSGIGNLYADEICYQARLHPASIAGTLKKQHIKRLFQLVRSILIEACEKEAYYQIYPENWFWKWRDSAQNFVEGKGTLGKMKIGGRTTYFVEGYQKLIN
ncbi:MAG: DNA-(apurinic or apyrimidinic site) lyase [Saprospiraceae bacterium]|nr:DNA-(apurinic or apyrimidinic site) lyase [Saprospiraceae bacterium]